MRPKIDDQIHSLPHLKENRTLLRSKLTPAEATLWKHLKSSQLNNRKFIRQHSIENYIVDFYYPSEKLIIELDGQGHFNPMASQHDYERTQRLEQLGFTIIRFENKLVFDHIESVLAEISSHFKNHNSE